MKKTKIALKPYLDTIQGYCSSLSKAELTGVIIHIAKGVSTAGRVEFLGKIESSLPLAVSGPIDAVGSVEEILNDIEALKESIEERIESIENGTYWDYSDRWDSDGYNDEGPDYVSEDQLDEIAAFFDVAGDLFLHDGLADARKVYSALFELIQGIEEIADVFLSDKIEIREERARYCRCVYETAKKKERLEAFAGAMEVEAANPYDSNEYDENYPRLQDVIDAKRGEMADLDLFLVAWKKMLTGEDVRGRPAVLLLETVHRLEGIGGVSKLARKWKNRQPLGYIFWLDILKKGKDQQGMIKTGSEGLKALGKGRSRERVAQFLIEAAKKRGDAKNLLMGKRERFFSRPSDQNQLELVAEAVKQDVRKKELEKMVTFFRVDNPEHSGEEDLYIKALLMAGKLSDAFALVEKEKSVGWSYSGNAGVVFGSILSVLADHSGKATTIKTLLRGYANRTSVYSERFTISDAPGNSFYNEILKGLKQVKHTKAQKGKYFSWTETIGKDRIDHIVSNKHRNAYRRAAEVLGSLAETYLATGQDTKAERILHHFYAEKYNRFSAFRREVKIVVSGSRLLGTVGF